MSNILHVEDSADWVSTVKGLLEDEGHQVIHVSSVDQARRHLEEVDIIVCDGNLIDDHDGMGFNFALELKNSGHKVIVFAARRRDPQIPFVSKYDYQLLCGAIAQL